MVDLNAMSGVAATYADLIGAALIAAGVLLGLIRRLSVPHRGGGRRGDALRHHARAAAGTNPTPRVADSGRRDRGVGPPRLRRSDGLARGSAARLPRGVVPPALRIVRLPVALGRSGIRDMACALLGEHVYLREVPPGSPRKVAFNGGAPGARGGSGALAGGGAPPTRRQTARQLGNHR